MRRLTIDFEAEAAYLSLTDSEVARTLGISQGVLVDLDADGRTVGVEVYMLSANLPDDRTAAEFGLDSEILTMLKCVNPLVSAFTARATR